VAVIVAIGGPTPALAAKAATWFGIAYTGQLSSHATTTA